MNPRTPPWRWSIPLCCLVLFAACSAETAPSPRAARHNPAEGGSTEPPPRILPPHAEERPLAEPALFQLPPEVVPVALFSDPPVPRSHPTPALESPRRLPRVEPEEPFHSVVTPPSRRTVPEPVAPRRDAPRGEPATQSPRFSQESTAVRRLPPVERPAVEEGPLNGSPETPPPNTAQPNTAQPNTPQSATAPAEPRRAPGEGVSHRAIPPDHPALRPVTAEADRYVRHGFSLAERGAIYSARAEFIHALRVITQALDALQPNPGEQLHSQALARALRALEEVRDFEPVGSQLEGDMNLAGIVVAHRTPVLRERDSVALSPLLARQSYYTYAQEQLAIAGGGQPAASQALHGLGKLYDLLGRRGEIEAGPPTAIAVHQAALLIDPRNFRSANELAVLLARYGQMHEAKRLLVQSVSTSPRPESWRNLAVVHARLGEEELARKAVYEAELLARNGVVDSMETGLLQWVAPEQLQPSLARGPAGAGTTGKGSPRLGEEPSLWPWKR